MDQEKSFEQFFETELTPALLPLEEQRKAVIKKITLTCGVVAVGAGVLAHLFLNQINDPMFLLFAVIGAVALGAGLL
jgi:hypothetical protein